MGNPGNSSIKKIIDSYLKLKTGAKINIGLRIQNLRKDAGFSVEDRIEISWDLDGQIAEAVGKFERYFCGETLTQEIKDNIENADYTSIVKLNEFLYNINLKKK